MTLLIYIIKTIFISGALLSYYWLILRNRPFHVFNRFFLLSIPLLSLVIPALHINPAILWNSPASGSPIRLLGVARGTWEEAVTIYGSHKKGIVFTWTSATVWISILISICLLSGFIKSLRFLHGLKKQNPFLQLPEATLYFVSEKGTPFSFFRSIFWGRDLELSSTEGKQILRHELFHVRQQHSLDILLMELCTILMWFNPFLHIIRFELKAIHEYAADAFVTADTDEYAYAKLLLLNISGASVSLVHPFFKNQIKRRITMITKTNKNKKALLGRFMILPLLLLFICLFSFKLQNTRSPLSPATLSPAILRVVIDPGHGGVFNGTTFNGDILEGIEKYGQQATIYDSIPHVNRVENKNLAVTINTVNEQSQQIKQVEQVNEVQQVNQVEQVKEVQQISAYDSSSPHRKVEIEAQFPGGSKAWVQYLIKNVNYPPAAVTKELQGDVQVEFIVNIKGDVSGVRAISGPEELRAESVRVIKESGKWIPAVDQGKKVTSYKIQPINYRLQQK